MKCKFEKLYKKEFEKESNSKSIYNIIQKHQLYTKKLHTQKERTCRISQKITARLCVELYTNIALVVAFVNVLFDKKNVLFVIFYLLNG